MKSHFLHLSLWCFGYCPCSYTPESDDLVVMAMLGDKLTIWIRCADAGQRSPGQSQLKMSLESLKATT